VRRDSNQSQRFLLASLRGLPLAGFDPSLVDSLAARDVLAAVQRAGRDPPERNERGSVAPEGCDGIRTTVTPRRSVP